MDLGYVSTASIIGMIFTLCISFGIPIFLLIFIRKKTKADITSFFIGTAVFIVFALVLEQILHTIVGFAAGNVIRQNIWLYALYGGVAAGLFEETGRFVAMHFFMKKNLNMSNALMYGAGHGGTEAILLVGITSVNNIIISFMINTGMFQKSLELVTEEVAQESIGQLSALWTLPSYQFFMGGIERLSAIILHIALSVLVYQAVKNRKKLYWIIAFFMHAFVDFTAVISTTYLNIIWAEVLVALLTAVTVVTVFFICGKNKKMTN